MNILPLFDFTPLKTPSCEYAPLRVGFAAATGYLFSKVAETDSALWVKVAIITTTAQEAFFLFMSAVVGVYQDKTVYVLTNALTSAITVVCLRALKLTSNTGTLFLGCLVAWNWIYGLKNLAQGYKETNVQHI